MYPDSKVHGSNMGPIWGGQDPGGPHVGPMKFAIWEMLIQWSLLSEWGIHGGWDNCSSVNEWIT